MCDCREDPEVLLEERQQLKTDLEDQLDEVRSGETAEFITRT